MPNESERREELERDKEEAPDHHQAPRPSPDETRQQIEEEDRFQATDN
jgi:hypothetical protein